jgi:branched-chain amino acid transport system permease protein
MMRALVLPRKHAWGWVAYAALLLLAPLCMPSNFGLSLLSQMGIAIVACLSYNVLLGQGGMLSFGHSVYTGLAAFIAVHALNHIAEGGWPVPVIWLPLLGGMAGLVLAALLGAVTTRKSGTPFAMITLGLVELIAAMALMVPEFFGGEGGVTANRTAGPRFLGLNFGPQIQVYYLLAAYTFVCTGLLYAFTCTPLGRLLNAVRDNAERVEFLGFNAQRVRWLGFIVSGFFAGVAGGMYALNFEIATAEVVGAARSGAYLLFTFLGGSTVFFGPILGGVLMVLATAVLSEWTKAWLLYLGLAFLIMVVVAPGGLAAVLLAQLRLIQSHRMGPLWAGTLALGGTGGAGMLGGAALIEMVYHLQLNETLGPELQFLGLTLSVSRPEDWVGAAGLAALGSGLFMLARRQFASDWQQAVADTTSQVSKGPRP